MTETPSDIWTNWLLQDRYGGDAAHEARGRARVQDYADRILNFVDFHTGMTLLDLGTGEGQVAFRAIERFGPGCHVTMSDISESLLSLAQARARAHGLLPQCAFLVTAADDLSPIADQTIDVVTARSVLAYVAHKPRAFSAIFRVLRPGGRLSIAEPVFRDDALAVVALRDDLDRLEHGQAEPILSLLHRWKSRQFPDTAGALASTAITHYTERDLVRFAQEAGFVQIHLEFHMNVDRSPPMSWETFLRKSPHPMAPTLQSILAEEFSPLDRGLLESALRPRVEAGGGFATERMAYLTAVKPDSA